MSRISSMPLLLVTTPSCSLKSNFIFAVFDLVLEVDVVEAGVFLIADVGEGEIVGTDEANGAVCEQSADDTFGPDEAVFGVCALQELVEQEEDRRMVFGEVADVAEAGDLGVEAGAALLERVVDEDAGAYL